MANGSLNREDVSAWVRSLVAQRARLPEEDLAETTRLDDLAFDSIDLVVVFTTFEQRHGVSFDNDDIEADRYATLGDLINRLAG